MSIVVGCPIRNRAWLLLKYLEAIYNLDYPKGEIILCFLINDSNDETFDILADFQKNSTSNDVILSEEESKTFYYKNKYLDIIVVEKNYNFDLCDRELGRNTEKFQHFAKVRNDWCDLWKKIEGVTHIFSIDSDVIVLPDSLKKLLSNNKDICSMIVNNSIHTFGYGKDITNLFSFNQNYEQYENIIRYPKDKLFEVDVTGSAYLVKREIFDKVSYLAHPLGEDFGFCIKTKQLGYGVWCDSSIKSDHIMKKD